MINHDIKARANEIRADWYNYISPMDLDKISDRKLIKLEDQALLEAGISMNSDLEDATETQQECFWNTLENIFCWRMVQHI